MSKGTYSHSNRHRMHELKQKGDDFCCKKHTKYMKTNETDEQLLALMTHVQAFLKGRLTVGELAEAEERAEIFRTNQVTNYDEVANLKGIIKELKRILSTCMYALQESEELMKDKERLDWLIDHAYIQFYKVDDGGEWEMELDASDARNHIDKEMEDAK